MKDGDIDSNGVHPKGKILWASNIIRMYDCIGKTKYVLHRDVGIDRKHILKPCFPHDILKLKSALV